MKLGLKSEDIKDKGVWINKVRINKNLTNCSVISWLIKLYVDKNASTKHIYSSVHTLHLYLIGKEVSDHKIVYLVSELSQKSTFIF